MNGLSQLAVIKWVLPRSMQYNKLTDLSCQIDCPLKKFWWWVPALSFPLAYVVWYGRKTDICKSRSPQRHRGKMPVVNAEPFICTERSQWEYCFDTLHGFAPGFRLWQACVIVLLSQQCSVTISQRSGVGNPAFLTAEGMHLNACALNTPTRFLTYCDTTNSLSLMRSLGMHLEWWYNINTVCALVSIVICNWD